MPTFYLAWLAGVRRGGALTKTQCRWQVYDMANAAVEVARGVALRKLLLSTCGGICDSCCICRNAADKIKARKQGCALAAYHVGFLNALSGCQRTLEDQRQHVVPQQFEK